MDNMGNERIVCKSWFPGFSFLCRIRGLGHQEPIDSGKRAASYFSIKPRSISWQIFETIPKSSIVGMLQVGSWFCSKLTNLKKTLKTLHFVKANGFAKKGWLTLKIFDFVVKPWFCKGHLPETLFSQTLHMLDGFRTFCKLSCQGYFCSTTGFYRSFSWPLQNHTPRCHHLQNHTPRGNQRLASTNSRF